jgi:Protein of unknown function (DUF4011)/REase_MTES_1575/AAA domain
MPENQQQAAVVLARIEDWRRRLIDLSYRNRLIRYRPTSASTLEIAAPTVDILLADLDRTAPWKFYFPPETDEIESDASDNPDALVSDTAAFLDARIVEQAQLVRHAPRADEIVVRESSGRKINRVLDNLARKSNAEFQDKALRILYVAAGFLEWVDPSRGEQLVSPLVLVPVELRRDSPRHPYMLYFADDEEVVVNPSLTEKLRRDLGREIPLDWTWEDKAIDVELDEIEAAVAGSGWSVRRDAVLGLFSFQKFVMYRDLLDNEAVIATHPVVRSLARNELVEEIGGADIEIPPLAELDEEQPPERDVLILDSDSSQRRAIEAARRGQSFVMHGPPGTGKSQTIANLIADAIVAGKRVLFVSEKAAALDVVHRRLKASGLDEFCLMLHGEHAARREVVEELHRSLTSEAVPRLGMNAHELERLGALRDMLNNSAQLPHLPEPILGNRTMRDVLGYLAQLHDAPSVPKAPEPGEISGDEVRAELLRLEETFQRMAELWAVSPNDFVWRDVGLEKFTSETRGELLARVLELHNASHALSLSADGSARLLGWPIPLNPRAVDHLLDLADLLSQAPALAPHWLELTPNALAAAAHEARAAFEAEAATKASFDQAYTSRTIGDFPGEIDAQLEASRKKLADTLGVTPLWEEGFTTSLPEIRRFLARAGELVDQILAATEDAAVRLGQPDSEVTLDRVDQIASLVTLAFSEEHRPEPDWLVAAGLSRARAALNRTQRNFEDYQLGERELLDQYERAALDLDAAGLLDRFMTVHTGALAKLRGGYRRDAKAIKAVRKDKRLPDTVIDDLTRLVELQRLGNKLDAQADKLERAFGHYYEGRATPVDDLTAALAAAERIGELSATDADLDVLATRVCVGSQADARTAQLADRLSAGTIDLNRGLELLAPFVGRARVLSTTQSLASLKTQLSTIEALLGEFAPLLDSLAVNSTNPLATLTEHQQRAQLIAELHRARSLIAAQAPEWQALLSPYYRQAETEWRELEAALEWVRSFTDLTGGTVPEPMCGTLISSDRRWPDFAGLRETRSTFQRCLHELARVFTDERSQRLVAIADGQHFQETTSWCDKLEEHIDDVGRWIDLRGWRTRAGERGWGNFVDELVNRNVDAVDLVNAFRRAYWSRRLEALLDDDQDLADPGTTYDRWIDEFKALDRRLIHSAADRLIAIRNKNRVTRVAVAGSEVSLLRREAAKKRRHMPVRKLLAAIPGLLSDLKPCLMMSPLTVSHFLAPTHSFDIVVFDEASQVPPQDAVNCVYRGKQLIVAGDGRQLPPTPFFQVAELEDAWREDSDEPTEDMESILDSCEALLPEHSLRWHYRSRHEHLIAFSNEHIYDRSLLTFPSADHHSPTKGVRFTHVPDGVYERGRTAANRPEARVVAERVIAHLQQSPRSVGVIAFNLAQSNAISEELDRLRIEHPDLEPRFAGDRLDAVFVKHLESVQGDERDVIIFSVGYGPDKDGRFTMNFGPLNKEGGFRRLNVAITRARDLVELVSSVRAADFNLSDSAPRGPKLLREYIRYAETNGQTIESTGQEDADDEYGSELEAAVAEVVRELGYEPVPQIGAGAFRIDIGVRDPDDPDQYRLGILTDGLFYAQTPTARDRNRLQEEVLTRILKWRLHRVWALDWVRNRQSEVEKLAAALSQEDQPVISDDDAPPVEARERAEREITELQDALDATQLAWVETYRRTELPAQNSFYEFHVSVNRERQRDLLVQLLQTEAPVHSSYAIRRLVQCWGMQKTSARSRQAGKQAIKMAARAGLLEERGEFLWLPDQQITTVRAPDWSDGRTERSIGEIPPEEIDLAIAILLEASGGSLGDHLFSDIAKVLGFDRVGPTIREVLSQRLNAAQLADSG